MEDNSNFYKAEYGALTAQIASLTSHLESKIAELAEQQLLLEELYELVYYKRAWLTLSDENIEGMKKIIHRIPLEDRCSVTPRTSAEYAATDDDEPWGV
tara:strand:+ start:505 stop:801 length:297 start_codon:yes stop_codon:yes gene_type:complete